MFLAGDMTAMFRGETYLTTPRIVLRRFTTDDALDLYELDGDPEVMRYISRTRTPLAHIRDVVLPGIIRRYEEFPGFGMWAAHDRETGEFIGWFELSVRTSSERRRPELGYRLARTVWGRGLATEGSTALIEKAFRDLDVDAVFAQTMAVNAASRRVMEKVGMCHVRTFHLEFDDPLPGTEQGEVEYEITRDEWLAHRRDEWQKG